VRMTKLGPVLLSVQPRPYAGSEVRPCRNRCGDDELRARRHVGSIVAESAASSDGCWERAIRVRGRGR
jgi:hypothetical protein